MEDLHERSALGASYPAGAGEGYRSEKCITIKSVVVAPEYWDTGVAILLFDERARRAAASGSRWADLSLTAESNVDTWPLTHHMGPQIDKRYRFYKKENC